MTNTRYGALEADWDKLTLLDGLTADLLPVVSNPHVKISPLSKLASTGKTPSILNRHREVAGIKEWTQKLATESEIEVWRGEQDYGICIQTRVLRALDVDVENEDLAGEIKTFINGFVANKSCDFAIRFRENSSKFLVPFTVLGDSLGLRKRVMHFPDYENGGMIEFLATGQQFIAHGMHPSGVPYVWTGEDFGQLTLAEFEELWENLAERFGGVDKRGDGQARRVGADIVMDDYVAQQLESAGMVKGVDGKQLNIVCPFHEEHTGESGESSTTYFPAGTNGYMEGHFRCLHGHCEGRTDAEFMAKAGIGALPADKFEVLPTVVNAHTGEVEPDLPNFDRMPKTGVIKATISNVEMALSRADVCGFTLSHDKFLEEIILQPYSGEKAEDIGGVVWDARNDMRILEDEDFTRIQLHLERVVGFAPLGREMIRNTMYMVALNNAFDSYQRYVAGLVWDGVPRVHNLFIDYFKCEECAIAAPLGAYFMSGMAGRALDLGVQADIAPILCGGQGIGKTSAVRALAPHIQLFGEVGLTDADEKRARMIRGKAIVELGEMRGLHTGVLEDIKSFITRIIDSWIPKYKEQSRNYARRCMFMGTSNHHEILNDMTGSRRFVPLTLKGRSKATRDNDDEVNKGVEGDCEGDNMIDVEALKRDAEQLLAEGAALYNGTWVGANGANDAKVSREGVQWRQVVALLNEHNKGFEAVDPWEVIILRWLNTEDVDGTSPRGSANGFLVSDVLVMALGHAQSVINHASAKRVGEILRKLGFSRKRVRVDGERQYVWIADSIL